GGWVPGVDLAGAAASNFVWASVTSDDAYKGSDPGDAAQITQVELYNWTGSGSDSYLNSKWRSVYEGVSRSNATLRLLKKVQTESPGAISAADARRIQAEAIFLRAFYHFEGWRMWGNIPYYKEDDTDFRKANNAGDVIPLILADLDAAIAALPATPARGEKGRVSSWAAKAFKGRVQMYANNHAAALVTLRDVVNNGPYRLEPNFHRVWTGIAAFANGPETIIAYQASANDGNPGGDNANFGERLNFPHAGSPFGCCGFHQPSQNLVNFFKVDANGLPLALATGDVTPLNATASWNASSANFDSASAAPVDPRLDWTVGRDGVPYKDWGRHAPTWIRDPGNGGRYSPKKNVHEKGSGAQSNVGWVNTQLNSVNIHLLRYADVMLLLAEAEVEVGSMENARTLVNQIRARAGAAAQGPGTTLAEVAVPINDPRITWANYRVGQYTAPFANKEFARSAVRYERRLELAMEGHRFFDLRRWGLIQPVLNEYISVEKNRRAYLAGALPVTDRHKLYPIPSVQVALSKVEGAESLKQNPGW
ncbi:MAG: RagB/SusD family nutrient uptake outer membrane protein, partial [Gemmatimonadetes bacterium]|nr:RagB/SusD family nutrient uptake outer membrane protein [Gemmatimonadota bacterium]